MKDKTHNSSVWYFHLWLIFESHFQLPINPRRVVCYPTSSEFDESGSRLSFKQIEDIYILFHYISKRLPGPTSENHAKREGQLQTASFSSSEDVGSAKGHLDTR